MESEYQATILVVESAPAEPLPGHELSAHNLLQGRFSVRLAASGAEALRMLKQGPRPDLIVLGAALADMDGVALLHELRANFLHAEIPAIFLVSPARPDDEAAALREGAADAVAMPASAAALQRRVATQLQLAQARAMLEEQGSRIDALVAERRRDAHATEDATVLAMALLTEGGAASHLRRIPLYFGALARELRFHDRFSAELGEEAIALMARAAPLHDIGKALVPDAILNKPGRLTPAEFEVMKLHTVHGRDALAAAELSLGAGPASPFLRYAREIAYSHQEKWDGSGYPQGLAGDAIPLPARLMAVADVYDALITKRVYKPAFTHETAVELIRQGSGEHFDPDVVGAMLVVEEKFRAIAAEFPDPD